MDENALEAKIKTLTYIVIGGFVVTILLIVGMYFQNDNSNNGDLNSTGGEQTTTNDPSYDTSRLNIVDAQGAIDLFKDKKTHVLYIGRPDCGVCQIYLPNLNSFIDQYKVEVSYLQMNVDTFRSDWADLFDYLDVETSINSNGETYEGTYGELLKANGFTPITIVIKNGKMVDGYVGSRSADNIKSFLSEYMDL